MTSKRKLRAGLVPARIFSGIAGVVAAFSAAAAPLPASAAAPGPAAGAVQSAAVRGADGVTAFYRSRSGRPLWLASQSGAAAQHMLALLSSAGTDGLNPNRYQVNRIARALRDARSGNPRAVSRAETLLSQAFVAYAADLRRAPDVGIVYVDRELMPAAPAASALLQAAASAPSLEAHVINMAWMNPAYAPLRRALASGAGSDPSKRRQIALNLERARSLPAGRGRYVVVNAAAQRLDMYEGGRVVDSMRVVVGKPKNPTPMMAAYIRYTNLNPYWNVPPDLAAERIAPHVVKGGVSYLKTHGYQVLSDWTLDPSVVDPKTIDWKAVEEGRVEVRIRQLPGPNNSMGRMKFMFPNNEGVYLHDTPERELLSEASRLFSGGCVRLEDAPRLGRWLHGEPLEPKGAKPEQQVALPTPVPVYLTYMTAVPDGSQIVFMDDIYGRDARRMAELGYGPVASR